MQRRQMSYRKPQKGMARSMTSAHVAPASSPSTKSPPKCLAKTGSIAAATLAHALERSEASASPAVDSNTFAASYWKQQVIATKRKLAAVVDRHTRDVLVMKQRLHRPIDNDETASLPHCSALDDARDATLRAIVSKPTAEPPPIPIDALVGRLGEPAEINVHALVVSHVEDLLARCRVAHLHTLSTLARTSPLAATDLIAAFDRASEPLYERQHDLCHQLARLCATQTVDAVDLKQFIHFMDAQQTHLKLSTRFRQRMEYLGMTHRSILLRRMHEIAKSSSNATAAPPRFLLHEAELDAAIEANLATLGIQEAPTAAAGNSRSSTDDLLAMLRRDFAALFHRHVSAFQDDSMPRKSSGRQAATSSGLFPEISSAQRHQRILLTDKRAANCMTFEAEVKFLGATDAQYALDRLEGLAASHMKRALLTIDPIPLRSTSVALVEPPNTPSLPDAKLKVYYILRFLVLRQFKHRIAHALNFLRSIETHVLLDRAWLDAADADHEDTAADGQERSYDRIDESKNDDSNARHNFVLVDDVGRPFVYTAALDDAAELELDLVTIGSVVTSLDERQDLRPPPASSSSSIAAVVDRISVLTDLFRSAAWYVEAKCKLVAKLFDAVYMHVTSAAAATEAANDLLTLIAARPVVDFTQRYFWDAIVSQVVAFDVQVKALDGFESALPSPVGGEIAARTIDDVLNSPAEAAAEARQAMRRAIAAVEAAIRPKTVLEGLALQRAVCEQAVVCWHVVATEETAYVTTASTLSPAIFANYYSKPSGAATLVLQGANEAYRRAVHKQQPPPHEHAMPASPSKLGDQIHALGVAYVDVLARAVSFLELQWRLRDELYATALLETIHRAHFQALQPPDDDKDSALLRSLSMSSKEQSLLDQTPAIEALAFVQVLRETSVVAWIAHHLNESSQRWLALTLDVQQVERTYLEVALAFNAMVLEPTLDFEASHAHLVATIVATSLANPSLDQNHKNFLAQVTSVVGQRALHDKIRARVQTELKAAAAICLDVERERDAVRRLVADRMDLDPTTDVTERVHEYLVELVESVKMPALVEPLVAEVNALRQLARSMPPTTINPFTLGGLSDRETLDAWLFRQLAPMEEQLGVAVATTAIDGVKSMAKGESIESLWCNAPHGDLVSVQYLPHVHEVIKRFAKTSIVHGRVVVRIAADAEPNLRRLIRLYRACVDVTTLLSVRAALHRSSSDDVFGSDLRDMLGQLHHDCFGRHDAAATHVNDLLVDWLETKRTYLKALHTSTVQAMQSEILLKAAATSQAAAYLLHEGSSIVGPAAASRPKTHVATHFIHALSSADCTTARNVWKLLEQRAGPLVSTAIVYLHKFQAFQALREYFMTKLSHVDGSAAAKSTEMAAIVSTELATTAAKEDEGGGNRPRRQASNMFLPGFPIPDSKELDVMVDSLRHYIEMQLVERDISMCRTRFEAVVKTLDDVSSPKRRPAVVGGQAKLNTVDIFVENVTSVCAALDTIDSKESHDRIRSLCRAFMAAYEDDVRFRQAATQSLDAQLRHRVAALELHQSKLEAKVKQLEETADEVLATRVVDKAYKIIFELEEAHQSIEMAQEQLEVEKARIVADMRAEYDAKLRDLSLALIKQQGQFQEFRTAVQNDLRVQLHDVQKSSAAKFIETGIPMQIKSQLVRSMRTNVDMEKVLEENTALKQTLTKLRTMYELKDATTQAAHGKAEAVLAAQLAKASLVFHQKSQVDAQLAATQTQVVALQKDLLKAQASLSSAALAASLSGTKSAAEMKQRTASLGSVVQASKLAMRLAARQKAKALLDDKVSRRSSGRSGRSGSSSTRFVDDCVDEGDEDEESEEDEDEQEQEDGREEHDEDCTRLRASYMRSTHHLHREIRRLQRQLAKETKAKTAALEQLQASRASAQVLLEHENTKLQANLADTQRRYVQAVHEIGALQQQLRPEPAGHTLARTALPERPKSCFPCPPAEATPRPKSSFTLRRPKTSFVRPKTSRPTTVDEGDNNQIDGGDVKRPSSAAVTKTPRKFDVLRREEETAAVEGIAQTLVARTKPLYR
ncbi:hypothetical protein Ae201684P_003983 [Aphanomyces euteiches]|uniref:Uncharacterized protein n=1 Tax=Aphanomyces euteiches TaxID=100861 RepID=A0A6G0XTF2_9STRA|nr:hypothetical protein Ae201684_001378 [Aphanomyces euteiches]KAH9075301.1 hypothetical protein Ae201684P_003983 [Aphanomyces euteiches]KAH9141021.1 hypothetical protein AeRB84_014749 [Aphanomyces euteiches]KAH9149435.1 hypothetical protein AeRB84_007490 [Aphanomyces euteiches]KAH9150213.1 hypothetical protein AeRB84_006910 [Aphanomyces euteiches]